MNIPMLPAQAAFVADEGPAVGLVAGWASGGSTAAALKAIALGAAWTEPGLLATHGVAGRDRVSVEVLRELGSRLGADVLVVRKRGGVLVELRGPSLRTQVLATTFEGALALWDAAAPPPWVVIDMAHLMPRASGFELVGLGVPFAAVGAAEGWGSWFHRGFAPDPGVFRDDPPGPPPIRDAVLHRLRTEENHYLPPGYVAARRSQMSPKAQRVYLDAEWVRGQ